MRKPSLNTARRVTAFSLARGKADAALVSRNVKIHRRRTSVRLEPVMWMALYEIASIETISIHDICSAVNDSKRRDESFSSALRVFLLKYYRDAARNAAGPGLAARKRAAEENSRPGSALAIKSRR